jgi:hypothetical protein
MAMEQTINRTDSVRVKLAPQMLERVEKLATDFGMPVATLCAFAVAEWVRQKDQNVAIARMAVMDAARRTVDQSPKMDDEAMERMLGPAVEAMLKQMTAQQSLPLDRGEPDQGAK